LGVDQRVTTFTDAESNRTVRSNKNNGTGLGWGGYQLALGGSVRGGDVTQNISNEQYSAAFAKWLGVDPSGLNRLFPGLAGMAPGALEFRS
jgi:hypothetical protein